jgi:hypothetical protein
MFTLVAKVHEVFCLTHQTWLMYEWDINLILINLQFLLRVDSLTQKGVLS